MSDARRLLVIKLSSLGDLFHALPAVDQLHRHLGAAVDWVTQPEYRELVSCFEPVDRVIEFPRRNFIAGMPGFLRSLRGRRYDCVIDLQGLLKSAFVTRWSRADRKIGPSFAREMTRWYYRELAGPMDRSRHAVEECRDALRLLDIPVEAARFPVRFPAWRGKRDGRGIAVVPCSRHPSKNWPLDHFAEAASALLEDPGLHLYLVGGPEEREACARLEQACAPDRVTNLCAATGLAELGGVLAEMDLVLTNDSGPMHMAAAVGVPVLALFGPTDPNRTGPYGTGHRVLRPPGVGDLHEYRNGDASLISRIGVEEVVEQAREMLTSPA